jgi:hypothetical protein
VLEKRFRKEVMATKAAKFISEGGSSNRPPLFEGDDYYYY